MGNGDKRKSDAERQERRRRRLADAGIKPMTVHFPEQDRALVRDLSRKVLDGQPIRQAMRELGGANEPAPDELSPDVAAELEAARARIAVVEREAEAQRMEIEAGERQRKALEVERDAARAAEAAAREQGQAKALEAQEATKSARDAGERAREALQRAENAEGTIQRTRSLPGLKGRLVRWLAGDVLD